jgi:hypothetical protein
MTTENEMAAARRLIVEIFYEYANHPESARSALEAAAEAGGEGWINGTVRLHDNRVFAAGGGWIANGGMVEPYGYRDAGQVDELADAIGLDIEDTMQLLRADCPKEWTA